MKVKVNQNLFDPNGEVIKPNNLKSPVTLRDVIVNSILEPKPIKCPTCGTLVINDSPEAEKDKYNKYEIFKKLKDPKKVEVELTSEEIVIIKREIGRLQPTLIMGQAFDLLEGNKK